MGYKTFKQYDSRWGSKNYNGSSNMAQAGCGPTAVADLVHAIKPKITPWKVAKYMKEHGYAVYGNGTAWAGIPAAMKHYGFEDVRNVSAMSDVFKLLKKGYCAVFLMRAGSRGGITWTTAGHFIAVTNIKAKDGKHLLYTRDPGGRDHDGWYCYETQMRGLIPQIWMGKVPETKKEEETSENAQNEPVTDETASTDTTTHPALYKAEKGDLCYDLSVHQGELSKKYFKGIKKKGVKCVILRSSYTHGGSFTLDKDEHFDNNIKNAIEAGMHIGAYHFSQAMNEDEAKQEAKFCLKCIKPYMAHIDLPVGFDWESYMRLSAKVMKSNGKTKNGKIVDAFCNKVKKAGYEPMIYASLVVFNNYLPANIHKSLKIWVAQYYKKCEYKHDYYLWQFTSNNGKLDENVFGKQDTTETSTETSTSTAETSTSTTDTSTSTAETSTETTESSKAEKLNETAIKESWAFGTKKAKYSYPNGAPKKAYKKDLNAMFPDRSGWRKQTRLGASCDVFAGTAIRASGADKKFPRMLEKAIPYLKEHPKKWKKIKATDGKYKPKNLKGGDVVVCLYKGSGGHICIVVEKGGQKYIAEAGYNSKRWPVLAKKLSTMNKSSYQMLRVYRPRG